MIRYFSLFSLLAALFLFFNSVHAQIPHIGAQVFIEPGQTKEEVEGWFKTLKEHDMTVCRIRMFENHMRTDDGWDFSRYDYAFDMAEKYGVNISATLFPTDESLGGFKFPESEAHQKEIEEYVRATVKHFKGHKALDSWVLMNEPGSGWSPWDEYAEAEYKEWLQKQEKKETHDYLKADYSKELFWRDYTTKYLKWLNDIVRDIDKENMTHLNNHMLFFLLREYEFSDWMPFLSNLGASIHASWHLEFFDRQEYNLAIAANCDIIKDAAKPKPFWVTELQGGPNTFSAFEPMTPTKEEIAQWLWTCIGSGSERTIFWTLNARASVNEAGEWAMVDFQNKPTARLTKAGEIAAIVKKEADIFGNVKPIEAKVTLLYSPLSMITYANKVMSAGFGDTIPARSEGAHIKAVLAYYKILTEMGIPVELKQFEQFNWENKKDHTLILPNVISIPEGYAENIETFVENGNELLVTGMTGLFDEYQHNVFMSNDPYKSLFGATMIEWQFIRDPFDVKLEDISMPVANMRGVISNNKAEILAKDGDDVLAVKNKFGDGEVIWIPSNVDLGAWTINQTGLKSFVTEYLTELKNSTPFYLEGDTKNITNRVLKSEEKYLTVFINTDSNSRESQININLKNKKPRIIYSNGGGSVSGNKLMLNSKETLVVVWE